MLASAHSERGKAWGGAAGVRGEESGTYDPLPEALHDCGHARKARLSGAEVLRKRASEGEAGLEAVYRRFATQERQWRLACRRTHDIAGGRESVELRSTWRLDACGHRWWLV